MTLDQLRGVHQVRPFRPFRLHMADGVAMHVPHPEFLWFHPRGGRTIFVAGPDDTVRIIDLYLVASIELGNGNARRSDKKRK